MATDRVVPHNKSGRVEVVVFRFTATEAEIEISAVSGFLLWLQSASLDRNEEAHFGKETVLKIISHTIVAAV